MLFDFPHILFMVISFSIVAVLEIVFFKYVHNQKTKDTILKLSALLTLIIHHSSLWYDFIVNKQAIIEENMLFMIYPCNVAMWFLFIYAFIDYKDNIVMKMLAEYTFYLGIFGGIIGIMFNQNYGSNPNLFDFHIFHHNLCQILDLQSVGFGKRFFAKRTRCYNIIRVVLRKFFHQKTSPLA